MMAKRKQCRLWWPEWLLCRDPSSGFLLFGWCFNAAAESESVDVVVAAAIPPCEFSDNLQQYENVQELLHSVNGRMPLALQESSTFTILGHCVGSCGDGDLEMRECQNSDIAKRSKPWQCQYSRAEERPSTGSIKAHYVSQPSGEDLSLESVFPETCRRWNCGCVKLDQGIELHQQSSTRSGSWIQLFPRTHIILHKQNKWIPKFHHMHLSRQLLPIHGVNLILYNPPIFGGHHFSLNPWDFLEEVPTLVKKPNWVGKLHKKPLVPNMDSVVLALNCSSAARAYSESCLSIIDSSGSHFQEMSFMLVSLAWYAMAVFMASISTIMYIILQLFHSILLHGSQRIFFKLFSGFLRNTLKNIHIRSCQFLYWPVFLQGHGVSCSLNVEYTHRAALQKHFIWSNVAIDVLLGNAFGLTLLANVETLSLWIMTITRKLTDDLLRSGFVWLMGVPAGFKLNTELAELLSLVSLNAIQVFSTLWFFTGSFLKYSIKGLSLLGIFMGLTVPIALCMDMLKFVTLHMMILHWLISLLYTHQIKALASLWRLFRGRKWNPLRQRLDSYDYTVEQHVVGSLAFTPLLLLLPTTSVFYIFITMLSTSISFICILLEIVISLLHSTPYFEILLWFLKRRRFPSGLWFQIIQPSVAYSYRSHGLLGEDRSAPSNLEPNLAGSDINVELENLVSCLHSNYATIGQVIKPFYRKVFQQPSRFSGKLPPYGILLGRRMPSTLSTHLPSTMPWMRISSREYWKICHASVISCRPNK